MMCLDLYGQSDTNGNKVDAWTCDPSRFDATIKGQQWIVDSDAESLRSNVNPSKCLDAGDMSGDTLQIWDCNGLPQQKFKFEGAFPHPNPCKVGYIRLERAPGRFMYLGVVPHSGGDLTLSSYIQNAQTWYVCANEDQLDAHPDLHSAMGNVTAALADLP